jgi:hypothetical protein
VTAWQTDLIGGNDLTPSTKELGKGAPHTGQITKRQVKAMQNEGAHERAQRRSFFTARPTGGSPEHTP